MTRTCGLTILLAVALALRVLTVWLLWSDHAGPIAYEHGRIAENLLAGRGFSIWFLGHEGPTSQQAPFYPLLMAAAYALLGVGSGASVLAVQLLQCVAGTALVAAVAWLGWSMLPEGPEVGWIAATVAAIYPTHLYMVTHLQVAPWAALGLTALLAVCVAPGWRTRPWHGVVAGLLAGGLLLVEPIMALTLPVCAAALYWNRMKATALRPALRPVVAMALTAAVVIAPWSARNWRVHGRPVFIKSTFGYAFWQANNPISLGTDKLPKPSAEQLRQAHGTSPADIDRAMWEARHETLYIDDVLLKPGGYREFDGLTEPQRSDLLGRRAWRFIRENPDRYAALCLNRLWFFLVFDETNPKAANPVYRATTVVWLVLAGLGLIASWPNWRRLWPTYVIVAVVIVFHALVITSVRFRIPIEPLTFIWIGCLPAAARRMLRP